MPQAKGNLLLKLNVSCNLTEYEVDESGKQKKFEWNEECQAAFEELKFYLSSPPLLTKAVDGEILYLYLGISDEAISSVLVREEAKQQKPIYYISNVLHGAEPRYPIVEKAALAVVTSARKLRPNFQSHPIIVLTDQPLRQILQKPECFGRLIKWAVELGEFEITFQQRSAIRAQALANFIGAGALLIGPDGDRSKHALKFNFDATNNMAEYEALLLGLQLLSLQLALELKISVIRVYSDSQLVVNQINSICEVVDPMMLHEATDDSTNPDTPSWTGSIIHFLQNGIVPEDRQEAMKLRKKASRYTLIDGVLYKRSFSLPLLPCLNPYETEYALREWGLDLLGPFVKGVGGVTHLIVGVDYFTKWVEARALSSLTSKKVEDFVFSLIICRYGISSQIVADNGTQFNCTSFRDFCSSYGIKLQFTSVYHLKSNGMVESVNKCILEGEILYHLAFETEAVIPIEIGVPSFKVTHFDEGRNGQLLRENLDLLDEVREEARLRTLVYKQKITNFYNKRVRPRTFKVGDLVLRKAGLTGFETRFGKLAPNWEGLYTVAKVPHPGAYILWDTKGKRVPRVCDVNNLKKFYP
ncbi:hypothetical protein SLEP1_g29568 [Rubroshorea leprosula]|uniref:Integrase catalytic domain-containing protein n=1 Tax=Rubroshorea leprosula TaxID=152421 RepID=A0AAV5K313_9ROSI|nr:hypothetical protein SLEP1_g29568 [Rubroshorea leprosula]